MVVDGEAGGGGPVPWPFLHQMIGQQEIGDAFLDLVLVPAVAAHQFPLPHLHLHQERVQILEHFQPGCAFGRQDRVVGWRRADLLEVFGPEFRLAGWERREAELWGRKRMSVRQVRSLNVLVYDGTKAGCGM